MTADPSVSQSAAADSARAAQSHPLPRWRERPERVAWVVLLGSFAFFLILLIGIPLGVQALYQSAAVKQPLRFEATIGTALFFSPRSDQPIALTGGREGIAEGSRLETRGAATQGVLGLPFKSQSDELMGTILVYPNTSLEIVRSRRPYFAGSRQPYTVRLRLLEGHIRLFTRSALERPVEIQIQTPHGEAHLEEGNYAFLVYAESTEVVVKQGVARLFQQEHKEVLIEPGLRTWMRADGTALPPVSAERNLLRDGAFDSPLGEVWESYSPPYITPGTVEFIEEDGRNVSRFNFRGPNEIHTEVGIRQTVDQDVHGYDSLVLKLDVKLIWQTLAGAGEQSSEFPLRVEITYTDVYGKVEKWGHGFYYRDPREDYPLFGGDKIEVFTWYPFESENLMELLEATKPAHIDSIRIYASGWNYEALASDVGLIVE